MLSLLTVLDFQIYKQRAPSLFQCGAVCYVLIVPRKTPQVGPRAASLLSIPRILESLSSTSEVLQISNVEVLSHKYLVIVYTCFQNFAM
jgi:hypothetical protein